MKRRTGGVEDLMWRNKIQWWILPSQQCPNKQQSNKDFREASSTHQHCHHTAKSHSKFRLLSSLLFVPFLNRAGLEKCLWKKEPMRENIGLSITNCQRELKNPHSLPIWRCILVISFHTADNIFYPPSQNGFHEILAFKFICQNDCWCSIERLYYPALQFASEQSWFRYLHNQRLWHLFQPFWCVCQQDVNQFNSS